MTTPRKCGVAVRVRLLHDAPWPHARWCEPVHWAPSDIVAGGRWADGAWWTGDVMMARLVCHGMPWEYAQGDVIWVDLAHLAIASTLSTRIIAYGVMPPSCYIV